MLKTLRFAAEGKTLLAFDQSSFELASYDSETGKLKKTTKIQQPPIRKGHLFGAEFVGDDRLVIYEQNGAILYDCATGAQLIELEKESYVADVASSADGHLVALSVHGGTRLIQLPNAPSQKSPMVIDDKNTKPDKRNDQPLENNSELRQWKSADGRFSVKAKLEKLADRTVHLEREDGSKIQVPLEKLSKEDQAWARGRK